MNNIDVMNFWIERAEKEYKIMKMFQENRIKGYSLFFGQLVIAKLLKALYAKKHKESPHALTIHGLLYLAQEMELKITERQSFLLDTISHFNDDDKKEFYDQCTDEYIVEQLENIEEIRIWLKELLLTEK